MAGLPHRPGRPRRKGIPAALLLAILTLANLVAPWGVLAVSVLRSSVELHHVQVVPQSQTPSQQPNPAADRRPTLEKHYVAAVIHVYFDEPVAVELASGRQLGLVELDLFTGLHREHRRVHYGLTRLACPGEGGPTIRSQPEPLEEHRGHPRLLMPLSSALLSEFAWLRTIGEDFHSLDSTAANLGQPFFPASARSRQRLGSSAANRVSLALLLGSTLSRPQAASSPSPSPAHGHRLLRSELHVPLEVIRNLLFLGGGNHSSPAANQGCSLCFATGPAPKSPTGAEAPLDWRLGTFRFDKGEDGSGSVASGAGNSVVAPPDELCVKLSLDPLLDASIGRAARSMLLRRGVPLGSPNSGEFRRRRTPSSWPERDRECLEQPWLHSRGPLGSTPPSSAHLPPPVPALALCERGESPEVLNAGWEQPEEDPFLGGWIEALLHGEHARRHPPEQLGAPVTPAVFSDPRAGPSVAEAGGSATETEGMDWLLDRTALVARLDPLLPGSRRFHVLALPPGDHGSGSRGEDEARLSSLAGAYEATDEPQIERFRRKYSGGSSHFDDAEQIPGDGDLGFLDASARAQIPFLDVLLGAIMNKFLGLTVKQVTDSFTNIISGEVLGRVIGAIAGSGPNSPGGVNPGIDVARLTQSLTGGLGGGGGSPGTSFAEMDAAWSPAGPEEAAFEEPSFVETSAAASSSSSLSSSTSSSGGEPRLSRLDDRILAELFSAAGPQTPAAGEAAASRGSPWSEVDRLQKLASVAHHRQLRRRQGLSEEHSGTAQASLLEGAASNQEPMEVSESDGALVAAVSSELVVRLTFALSDHVGNELVRTVMDPLTEDLAAELEPRLAASLKQATEAAVRRILPLKLDPQLARATHEQTQEPLLAALNFTLHQTLFPALAHSISAGLADTLHPDSPAHQDPSCWNACLGWRPAPDDPRFGLASAGTGAMGADFLRGWAERSEQVMKDGGWARPPAEAAKDLPPHSWNGPVRAGEDPRAWTAKPWGPQSSLAGRSQPPQSFLESESSLRSGLSRQQRPGVGEPGYERPPFGQDRGWDEFCSRCLGAVTAEEAERRARDTRFRSWFGSLYADYWRRRSGPAHPPHVPNPFARADHY